MNSNDEHSHVARSSTPLRHDEGKSLIYGKGQTKNFVKRIYSFEHYFYSYYRYIALTEAVHIADIFLMGELQQVAKGQEDAFTLHI